MNQSQCQAFAAYLDGQTALCIQRRAELFADSRQDEANFEKIRENIFDIFRTIFTVAQKNPDPASFFLERLEQIPTAWQTAYDRAALHADGDRMHLERLKLDTVQVIRARFREIQEVEK